MLEQHLDHAGGLVVTDPNGLFEMAWRGKIAQMFSVPEAFSVIGGDPALVYSTDEITLNLAPTELDRLILKALRPSEFMALRAEYGVFYEIADCFYDPDTGEALQPKGKYTMTTETSSAPKTKTIPFDKIKEKVTLIASPRLDKALTGLFRSGGVDRAAAQGADGNWGVYDLKLAMVTLVPSLMEAVNDGRPHTNVHKEMMDEVTQRCLSIIDRWDVRQVNRLIDLFPDAVPASCRLRNAVCEYDDEGEWVVTFDLTSRRPKSEGFSGQEELAMNFLAGTGGRLKALLPKVVEAQKAYDEAMEDTKSHSGQAGTEFLYQATANFNKVLERAAFAFYMDTQDYNHWNTIKQAYAPNQHGADPMSLWFGAFGPRHIADQLTKVAADLEAGVFEKAIREQAQELQSATPVVGGLSDASAGAGEPGAAAYRGDTPRG